MTKPTKIAIAVVKNGDRFLVGQRSQDQVLAGFWEFPGGKIKKNENPDDAIIRELDEELNIFIKKEFLTLEVCS